MSTGKHIGVTGRTISRIVPHKNSVEVVFQDGVKIKIDVLTYINGEKLYPGKEISDDLFSSLLMSQSSLNNSAYLFKLLTGPKLYSKKEIIDKLMNVKKLSYEESQKLLSEAYAKGLVNDDIYVSNYVNDASDKGYSKKRIYNFLIKNKYKEELINKYLEKVDFDIPIKEIVARELERQRGKNFNSIIDNLKTKLVRFGYSSGEISALIKEYLSENEGYINSVSERSSACLRYDMRSVLDSLKSSSKDKSEIKRIVFRRLIGRKYDINDIINMWEEIEK